MKDELHQRVQELLDAGGGLAPDEELARALEDAGEEARAEAEALAEVDAGLRAFAAVFCFLYLFPFPKLVSYCIRCRQCRNSG